MSEQDVIEMILDLEAAAIRVDQAMHTDDRAAVERAREERREARAAIMLALRDEVAR